MKIKILLFTTIFFFTFLSCKRENKENKQSAFDCLFIKSFNIIKDNSIKTELNWMEIEKKIKDSIPIFTNNEDVYRGVGYTLSLMDDKHSFFLPPNSSMNPFINDSLSTPEVDNKIIDGHIGYLKIVGLASNDSISQLYIQRIRNKLKLLDDRNSLSGWIIDLRNNCGGRMGMIQLGLAPFFCTDSIIGFSLNNENELLTHRLVKNSYYYGDQLVNKTDLDFDTLKNKNKPVAVLINEETSSQGEAVAMSFKFLKNTILVGAKTNGFTTDLTVYDFKSGARLGISTAYMCDINQNILVDGISPDINCKSENALNISIKWINNAL